MRTECSLIRIPDEVDVNVTNGTLDVEVENQVCVRQNPEDHEHHRDNVYDVRRHHGLTWSVWRGAGLTELPRLVL